MYKKPSSLPRRPTSKGHYRDWPGMATHALAICSVLRKNRGIHMMVAANKLGFRPLAPLTPACVTCVRCQTDQAPKWDTGKSGASGKFRPATLRSGATSRTLMLQRADKGMDTIAGIARRIVCDSAYLSYKHSGNYTHTPSTLRNPSLCSHNIFLRLSQ
jgi:hypothetical protein